ncbi:acyltransferase family protein [Ancylobacter pratisalsi]|uniref:Acyltransferase n=1 Tax=Ancylobacter pratisalsi TaxID=1745854 RepID=A0A6P1YLM3_9HYPH|nr:acyltransferase [Ancylobacter pratisalsi]QIB34268.1 acyltransferase [Ancylobacter pratisalsi]
MKAITGPGSYRLILASIVVVHHFSRLALGHMAVMLFFILSGYWIARMWTEKYSKGRNPYRTFILSRLMRLLPAFWLINLITLLALWFVDASQLVPMDTYLAAAHAIISNIFLIGYESLSTHPLGSAWSLDIEMQFYIAAPLVVAAVFRQPLLGLAGALVISIGSYALFDESLFTTFLLFFSLGIAAYRLNWRPSDRLAAASAFLGVAVLLAILATPGLRDTLLGGTQRKPAFEYVTLVNNILAIILIPATLATVYRRGGRLDSMYGDLSYIVYLLHWTPVVIVSLYVGNLPPTARLPYVALAFVLTYLGSWVIWIGFDHPLHAVRASVVNKLLKQPVAVPPRATSGSSG